MPDYAIVNLGEIEDSVGDRVPGPQGRFAREHPRDVADESPAGAR